MAIILTWAFDSIKSIDDVQAVKFNEEPALLDVQKTIHSAIVESGTHTVVPHTHLRLYKPEKPVYLTQLSLNSGVLKGRIIRSWERVKPSASTQEEEQLDIIVELPGV